MAFAADASAFAALCGQNVRGLLRRRFQIDLICAFQSDQRWKTHSAPNGGDACVTWLAVRLQSVNSLSVPTPAAGSPSPDGWCPGVTTWMAARVSPGCGSQSGGASRPQSSHLATRCPIVSEMLLA